MFVLLRRWNLLEEERTVSTVKESKAFHILEKKGPFVEDFRWHVLHGISLLKPVKPVGCLKLWKQNFKGTVNLSARGLQERKVPPGLWVMRGLRRFPPDRGALSAPTCFHTSVSHHSTRSTGSPAATATQHRPRKAGRF